jgi:hypothetical protein
LATMLGNSVGASAPESIQICATNASQQQNILLVVRVRQSLPEFLEDTPLAFKWAHHVITWASYQELVFGVLPLFPPH